MSIAAAQAQNFFTELAAEGFVWTIKDSVGFPTSTNASGETAMPFWSKESRAQTVIDNAPDYATFVPHKLSLSEFSERWLPGLDKDGLLVGVNWSGPRVAGYDMTPSNVLARLSGARA